MASEAILEHQISLGGMPLKLLRVFNRTPSISMSHVSTDMTATILHERDHEYHERHPYNCCTAGL